MRLENLNWIRCDLLFPAVWTNQEQKNIEKREMLMSGVIVAPRTQITTLRRYESWLSTCPWCKNWWAELSHQQIEQAAFSPSNFVEGWKASADPVLAQRLISYPDAAVSQTYYLNPIASYWSTWGENTQLLSVSTATSSRCQLWTDTSQLPYEPSL